MALGAIAMATSICITNGLDDLYPPFNARPRTYIMQWFRQEDSNEVRLYMSKINEIPKSGADSIYGLWRNESGKTLHLRWDKRYVLQDSTTRIGGVYHTSGHSKRLRFLPDFGDHQTFDYKVNMGHLTLTNKDTSMSYQRIRTFP